MKDMLKIRTGRSIKSALTFSLASALLLFTAIALTSCYKPAEEFKNYQAIYYATEGGKIGGSGSQTMFSPADEIEPVTAIAEFGYYFVKWSDGLTTSTRHDTQIKSFFEVTAEFAPINDGVTVSYDTTSGGMILGECNQTVQYGTDAWSVSCGYNTYVIGGNIVDNPYGYVFLQWSDGVKTMTRHDKNVTEPLCVTAEYALPVNYIAGPNGTIIGESRQIVPFGKSTSTVRALATWGYTFIGWSDGVKEIVRCDESITEAFNVTAMFEWREENFFTYNYNYATGNCAEKGIKLRRGEVKGKMCIVPEREHFTFMGWYWDKELYGPATDQQGKLTIGDAIFTGASCDLYAKWEVKREYVVTYKILMVCVTEIDATIWGFNGKREEVKYKMTDLDKRIYEEMLRRFSFTVNDMMDGLVEFEIDNYYTTKPVGAESLRKSTNHYDVSAEDIPELIQSGIMDDYRTVITTFSSHDNEAMGNQPTASGGEKFAVVCFDKFFVGFNGDRETVFEPQSNFHWDFHLDTYVHQFVRTCEVGIIAYELNAALWPSGLVTVSPAGKRYLLNQLSIDGERAGIPYTYWTNEIFTVKYEINISRGGYLFNGSTRDELGPVWGRYTDFNEGQHIPKGGRSATISVKVHEGYRFVGWSDGITTIARTDRKVQNDFTVTAIVEPQLYDFEFIAGEGGHIEGKAKQQVYYDSYTETVTAVADEGYRFKCWSDGDEYPRKSVEIYFDFDGNMRTSITAYFEKIEEPETNDIRMKNNLRR